MPSQKKPARAGTLYLVSTPIGDSDDITLRALTVLRTVALIAAEDSRVTRKLLQAHHITTELLSYRPRTRHDPTALLLERLQEGDDIALVSDAGTPAIADPGQALVRAALQAQIPVTAVPGPVAALTALVISGLPTGRFAFEGFPPRARADRSAFFAMLPTETRTLLLYESASWLRPTLSELARALGESRRIVVARDLTRPSETLFRGTLATALTHFSTPPRGEYTLVIAGA